MGDHDHAEIQAFGELAKLAAHGAAVARIDRGERLVKEQDPRLAHERARQGHALGLAARDSRGAALQQVVHAEHAGKLLDAFAALTAA